MMNLSIKMDGYVKIMSNDILDRLRETDYEPVCVDAIAEIKWLREQNAILQQAVSEEGRANRMTAMYEKSLIEIEQLRGDLLEAYDACRYALAQSPRWQENCATVIATWEARCG